MYEERWGFPMCAGAIDRKPHIEYVNRKGYHSILLQAVCDCHYLIRDAVIGWPGAFMTQEFCQIQQFSDKAMTKHYFLEQQTR